jgi:hypothetical protein
LAQAVRAVSEVWQGNVDAASAEPVEEPLLDEVQLVKESHWLEQELLIQVVQEAPPVEGVQVELLSPLLLLLLLEHARAVMSPPSRKPRAIQFIIMMFSPSAGDTHG